MTKFASKHEVPVPLQENSDKRIAHRPRGILVHTLSSALATACLSSMSISPALAQASNVETPTEVTVPATGACLSNTVKGGDADGKTITIAVPDDKMDKFIGRGFSVANCAGVRPATAVEKADVCRIAAIRNPGINAYFVEHFGFSPREACNGILVPVRP